MNGERFGRGVAFELIDFLKDKFNFTYEVVVPNKNIIGSADDFDGSLLEMLQQSKVDIAAAFLPFLSEQRQFVYYSTAVLDEGEWIMVMKRPSESATGTGLLAPFDLEVWIAILISLFAVGPIIYLLIILRNRFIDDNKQIPYSVAHCAWFVYGALVKQGSILSPTADSTRLLFATWWLFITILTSFYTANLTAFLTLSKFTLPFNTVEDILSSNKHFVTTRGGGVEYSIKVVNESLYMLYVMTLNNHAVFTTFTNDTLSLINYVENQNYVFVRDRPAIIHVLYNDYRYRRTQSPIESAHCPFAESKIPFLKKRRTFAYPLDSNITDLFDRELLRLVESGIIKHLSAKGLPNADICPQNLGNTERQLRNGDLIMTYYIIAAGFATSLTVFTTEIMMPWVNKKIKVNHLISQDNRDKQPIKWNIKKRLLDAKGVQSNYTPPPPYTITQTQNTNLTNLYFNKQLSPFDRGTELFQCKQSHFERNGVRRIINGREYTVYYSLNDGYNYLVPVRAPTSTLYQFTYTN